jgi:hypothetical protein
MCALFTDYETLVYDLLSPTQPKSAATIRREIEQRWKAEGKRSWLGGKKSASSPGIHIALTALKEEGYAESVPFRPHSKKALAFTGEERRVVGRRKRNDHSSFVCFVQSQPETSPCAPGIIGRFFCALYKQLFEINTVK